MVDSDAMMRTPHPSSGGDAIPSVSSLTYRLKGVVEGAFSKIQVEGELSNVKASARGHVWFTLRDPGAELSAVIWASTARRISAELRDGKKMVASGDIEIYPPHGRYRLIVRSIRDVGLGDRLAELQALRERLAQEGLFAPERKRELPLLPRRIGVVTSETGDALRDILTTLERRFPSRVLLAPCRVQGDRAAEEIVEAIGRLDAHPEVDVIIVGRGGGSIEDLWAFNEERVARAIADAVTPIVSAVGHEPDHLLSDDVADVRAATPTAAAELVVPSLNDLLAGLDAWTQTMVRVVERRLDDERSRNQDRLRDMSRAIQGRIAQGRARQAELRARLRNLHPTQRLAAERGALEGLSRRLATAQRAGILARRNRLARVHGALEMLSPVACLERGYSIVRDAEGRVVSEATRLGPGDAVRVLLHRGEIDATVSGIHPANNSKCEGS